MRTRYTVLLLALSALSSTRADEGMWLFSQFPAARVKSSHGVTITGEALDHLRLSSVRMGASASFVSPHGLIFTNHHVGLSCVQKVSTRERNYVVDGYLAANGSQELPCPATEASVLEKIEDVTGKVNAAAQAPAGSAEANRQRKAAIAGIEKECATGTGRQCEVVTL
jgi:hypothetical protein